MNDLDITKIIRSDEAFLEWIREQAQTDPFVYQLTMMRHLSETELLRFALIWLTEAKQALMNNYNEHLQKCASPIFKS